MKNIAKISAAAVVWIATTLTPTTLLAQPSGQISIEGELSVYSDELPGVVGYLEINGEPFSLANGADYSGMVPIQASYVVSFAGEDFHSARQTFSYTELYRADCACLVVPNIEIVARQPGRVELFFAGDAMAGRRYSDPLWGERVLVDPQQPYPDLMRLLDPIRPYVESADLASVNLETVLSDQDPGVASPESIVFYAPTALAQALADSGFDYVSLGNNHSYDYLDPGLRVTIDAVEEAGLSWSGAGFDEAQALSAAQIEVGGQSFAMLGYVGWAGRVEPNQIAEENKGGAAYGTVENISSSVCRELLAGNLPIAQMHDDREYSARPRERSVERMRAAIDAGAVMVASHHPHVTQGIEAYGGGLIAYSLGNFLFDQYFMMTHASYALRVWIDDGVVARAEAIPLRILDYRPIPAVDSTRQFVIERLQRLSAERGTRLSLNGGHLVFAAEEALLEPVPETPQPRDLVFWGDFENSVHGDAVDRTLHLTGASSSFEFSPEEGTVLSVEPLPETREVVVYPSTFFRNIEHPDVGFSVQMFTDQAVTVELLVQRRPAGVRRLAALENAPFETVASFVVDEGTSGRQLQTSFTLGGVDDDDIAPFRFALRISAASPIEPFTLDDLKVRSEVSSVTDTQSLDVRMETLLGH